ncbi:MAG: DUF4340 domain-containing protein [Phycisphaeraceae bacterium]|nr:DUF4340 domain-containing protein [Phycisphaeraceae bacterium]
MSQRTQTIVVVLVAAALTLLAWLTGPAPVVDPRFADLGAPLTPALTDPAQVASLEIIAYSDADARHRALRIVFDGQRWVVPSAFDYPADDATKIAQAASMFVGLTREAVVSDQRIDHAALGLVDPTDESGDPAGRGVRITIAGDQGQSLADLVIGRATEPGSRQRFVRLVGSDRAYRATFPADLESALSVNLADWVDPALLRIDPASITSIEIDASSVDEAQGRRVEGARTTIVRLAGGGGWGLSPPGEPLDTSECDAFARRIAGLRLVGVEPMPAKLRAMLTGDTTNAALDANDLRRLATAGYFISPQGRLLPNAGTLQIRTADGLIYTLWFGEVAESINDRAPIFPGDEEESSAAESRTTRRVLVTVQAADPDAPGAQEPLQAALRRLARWWFTIDESDFRALRPAESGLTEQTRPEQPAG